MVDRARTWSLSNELLNFLVAESLQTMWKHFVYKIPAGIGTVGTINEALGRWNGARTWWNGARTLSWSNDLLNF